MIPTKVIDRTFHIQVADSTGTCFTIDVGNKQYLVTAKHIVKDLSGICGIKIFHEKRWKNIPITVVGHCKGDIDISVLTAQLQLSPTHQLEATSARMSYGQDAYFLGFPYGMSSEVGKLNRDFPMPFVKKAIISCMYISEDGVQINFLEDQLYSKN